MFDPKDKDNAGTLIREAMAVRQNSYAPYSNFNVGAAIISTEGRIFTGCNVENSSYSATNCAERTALFSAVANGCSSFDAIAIVGGAQDGESDYCYPCGVCRQVLLEFCNPEDFYVIVAKNTSEYCIMTLEELLPHGFKL